jgi:hypothetical protein
MSEADRISTETPAASCLYERGEEVVARLEDVVAMPLGSGVLLPRSLPGWTIGTIVASRGGAKRWYLLAFRYGPTSWLCWVEEAAIEGTA